MADYERRRHNASRLEVAATLTAAGSGAALGAERVRDAMARDDAAKLARVATRAGKVHGSLKPLVLHARPGARVIGAGTVAGGTAYAAQKYQEHTLHREAVNARRQAKEAKKEKTMRTKVSARYEGGGVLAKSYRSDRHRRQAEGLAATGATGAAGSAVYSHKAGKKATATAATAAEARRAHGVKAGTAAAGSFGTGGKAHAKYHEAADEVRATRSAKAPKPPAKTGAVITDAIKQAEHAHDAAAYARHTKTAARKAGVMAASAHALATAAGSAAAIKEAETALHHHREYAKATRAAARHARGVKTRTGAALGLLATAAALHESKSRQPPVRHRLY